MIFVNNLYVFVVIFIFAKEARPWYNLSDRSLVCVDLKATSKDVSEIAAQKCWFSLKAVIFPPLCAGKVGLGMYIVQQLDREGECESV